MGFVQKIVSRLTGANKQAPRVIEAKVRDAFKDGWEASRRNALEDAARVCDAAAAAGQNDAQYCADRIRSLNVPVTKP